MDRTDGHLGPNSGPRALQEMWLQLVSSRWSSLVVVPADRGTSVRAVTGTMLEVFHLLELGTFVSIHAEGTSLTEGANLAKEIAAAASRGSRVVATVDFPLESPSAIPVVSACEAALLVVSLGAAEVAPSRSVIGLIGRERILGCVTVDARTAAAWKKGAPAPR